MWVEMKKNEFGNRVSPLMVAVLISRASSIFVPLNNSSKTAKHLAPVFASATTFFKVITSDMK